MKLWQKGNSVVNKSVEAFTTGEDPELDMHLAKYDLQVNSAHAKMLTSVGILSDKEYLQIQDVISEIKFLIESGTFSITSEQEDIHTAIEDFLIQRLGETGKKIHTARSRNDQVMADILLYCKDSLKVLLEYVNKLIESISQKANTWKEIPMPGYTHMQRAMPYSVHNWLLSFKEMLCDDLKGLEHAKKVVDVNPLGSAAGFGVSLPINVEITTKELKFARTFSQPLYIQNSKGKFESAVLFSCNQVMLTCNKLATDLMLFTTKEFNYFSLPAAFCTGSSIMPQKKNYDVLELIRGKTHSFQSKLTEVMLLYNNLMSGYNRDSQLMKKPLIEGIETTKSVLKIIKLVIENLEINSPSLNNAMSKDLYATEEVFQLVKKGIPFREAYQIIGKNFK